MIRRLSVFCVAIVVTGSLTILDTRTAEGQLFRRLRSRIEAAVPVAPPVQSDTQSRNPQRAPGPATAPAGSAAQNAARPQGQRVSPIGPSETRSDRWNRFGNSILVPNQQRQPDSGEEQTKAFAGGPPSTAPTTDRPTLGIEVVPSRGTVRGLQVVRISEHSKADEAGLQLGDVIVAVEGTATRSIAEVAQLLQTRNSGDRVRAEIVRGRSNQVVMLPLMANRVATAKPATTSPVNSEGLKELGIEIGPSEGDRGVMVTDVAINTPAAVAGLQAGDRIVSLDGRLLTSDTLAREFANRKVGEQVSLQVVRNGKLISADVTLADPATIAQRRSQQATPSQDSVLGGIGSVIGGLFSGNSASKTKPSTDPASATGKDEMAFGDKEPIMQVDFESDLEQGQSRFKEDPPSLEKLDLPQDTATPIQLDTSQQQTSRPLSAQAAREKIRQLRQQLKELEAYLEENPEQ